MTPPEFNTSSIEGLKRSLQLMLAYVQVLRFVERILGGLPNWFDATFAFLDKSLCYIENIVFECAGPSASLDELKAARAKRDAMYADAEMSDAAHVSDSNALCASSSVVTAEMRLCASGRPSRNCAKCASSPVAYRRAHAPHTDDLRHACTRAKVTPRARPPPTFTASSAPLHRTSPARPDKPAGANAARLSRSVLSVTLLHAEPQGTHMLMIHRTLSCIFLIGLAACGNQSTQIERAAQDVVQLTETNEAASLEALETEGALPVAVDTAPGEAIDIAQTNSEFGAAPDTLDPALIGVWISEDTINSSGGAGGFASFSTVMTMQLSDTGEVIQSSESVGGGGEWSYDGGTTIDFQGEWRAGNGVLFVKGMGLTEFTPASRYAFSGEYLVTNNDQGRMIWQRSQ